MVRSSFFRPAPAREVAFVCVSLLFTVNGFVACSDTATATSDAGVDASAVDAGLVIGEGETLQTGRAALVQTNKPVPEATISAGSAQTTADGEGLYSFIVPRNSPITLKVKAPDHYQLIEQEYIVDTQTYDRGDSLILKNQTASLLAAFFGDYDKTKALVAVTVIPAKGCRSEQGTTLKLEPAGAVLRYTQGGVPDNNTSLTAGETNGALFYNVTPGPVTVTAESPYCKPMPFPVKADGVTYTGKLTTEPGSSFSFIRIFLGPPAPATDAGEDATVDASSDASDAATD
ncbi:MAG: hypothetical protein U0174_02825 [Polyangiaceae bacterium]